MGLGAGIAYAPRTDDVAQLPRLAAAALAQLPAVGARGCRARAFARRDVSSGA
jgi:hypothetical protein